MCMVLITAVFDKATADKYTCQDECGAGERVSCRKVAVYKRAQLSVLIDWSVGYYRARSYLS